MLVKENGNNECNGNNNKFFEEGQYVMNIPLTSLANPYPNWVFFISLERS